MRVTPIMIANDMVNNLEGTYQNIETLGKQLASGKRILAPSDDPAGAAYAVDVSSALDINKQYQSSSGSALSWLQTTSGSLQQLSEVVLRARTLTVQGANDTNALGDRQSLATEMKQLVQQVVQIGNTSFAGNSIFAGTMTQTTPFNTLGGYAGNSGAISHQIAPGYSMQVNANASAIFTGANGIFSALTSAVQHLTNGTTLQEQANTGTEAMALTGSYSSGTPANYTVQVTGVNPAGAITNAQYSTDGGTTWTAVAGAGSPLAFNLGNGLSSNFTNGAIAPHVGDQFSFTASGTGAAFPVQAGKNIGNASVSLTGSFAGTGDPPVVSIKASQLDANNNVVGVQVSTDGGTTYGPTILAAEYTANGSAALSYPTPTTFDAGNGVQLTWTQSSTNAAQVVSNGDSFSFTPASVGLNNDLATLDKVLSVISGQEAQFGAQVNAIQANTTQLQSLNVQLQSTLSQTQDADFAALTTKMASAQSLYQAALAVDAKSIQPSLIDFLK